MDIFKISLIKASSATQIAISSKSKSIHPYFSAAGIGKLPQPNALKGSKPVRMSTPSSISVFHHRKS